MESRRIEGLLDELTFAAILSILLFIPFFKSGIEISLFFGFLFWFGKRLLQKNLLHFKQLPLFYPLAFYLLMVFISVFNSTEPMLSIHGIFRVVKYLILYFLVADTVRSKKQLQWVTSLLILASLLSCFNGYYQMLSGWDLKRQFQIVSIQGIARIRGSFNHPNNFAAYLATVIALVAFVRGSKSIQFLKYLVLPIYLYILFKTNSRMPFVFLLMLFAGVGLFSKQYRLSALYGMGITAIAISTYLIYFPQYLPRLFEMWMGDARIQYWLNSLDLAKQKPWLGHGVNTFMSIYGEHPLAAAYGSNRFVYAHNFMIHMLVEIGLFGLLTFLFVLFKFFVSAVHFLRKQSSVKIKPTIFGYLMGIVFLLLHSLVDNDLQSLQLTTFFWVLVGVVMGISAHEKTQSSSFQS